VPLLKSIQLSLPVAALIGRRTSAVPEISIDPLFTENCEKRGEGRGCEICVKQRLDGDDFGGRSCPDDGARVGVGEELFTTLIRTCM